MTRVVWQSGKALVASQRNLVIARWDGTPTEPQVHALEAHAAVIATAHPGGVALLNVIIGGSRPRFGRDARAQIARMVGRTPERSLGAAIVVRVNGFAGVAVRGFLSTALALARPRTPLRTFDTVERSASWLSERLSRSEPWTPHQVVRAWHGLPPAGEQMGS